jgi:hypothetical protein
VQQVENLRFAVFDIAAAVRVFNPQDELATLLASHGRVEQGNICGADVRVACR